jgi:hypothetical protein
MRTGEALLFFILPLGGTAVQRIAQDGRAQMGKMNPNLMRATRQQFAFHQGQAPASRQHLEAGLGRTTHARDGHLHAIHPMAGDGLIHQQAAQFGQAAAIASDGQVALLDGASLARAKQPVV